MKINYLEVFSKLQTLKKSSNLNTEEKQILCNLDEHINLVIKNYYIILQYLRDQYNLKESVDSPFSSLHEAIHDEIESEKAEKVLKQIGGVIMKILILVTLILFIYYLVDKRTYIFNTNTPPTNVPKEPPRNNGN